MTVSSRARYMALLGSIDAPEQWDRNERREPLRVRRIRGRSLLSAPRSCPERHTGRTRSRQNPADTARTRRLRACPCTRRARRIRRGSKSRRTAACGRAGGGWRADTRRVGHDASVAAAGDAYAGQEVVTHAGGAGIILQGADFAFPRFRACSSTSLSRETQRGRRSSWPWPPARAAKRSTASGRRRG